MTEKFPTEKYCGGSWPKDHPDITSARRIYPENES